MAFCPCFKKFFPIWSSTVWPGQQTMRQQARTDDSPEVQEVRTFLWLPGQELQPEASILVFWWCFKFCFLFSGSHKRHLRHRIGLPGGRCPRWWIEELSTEQSQAEGPVWISHWTGCPWVVTSGKSCLRPRGKRGLGFSVSFSCLTRARAQVPIRCEGLVSRRLEFPSLVVSWSQEALGCPAGHGSN